MSPKTNIFGTVAVMLWESVSKYLEAVLHVHNVLLSGFVVSDLPVLVLDKYSSSVGVAGSSARISIVHNRYRKSLELLCYVALEI